MGCHVCVGGMGDRLAGIGGGVSVAGDVNFCLGAGLKIENGMIQKPCHQCKCMYMRCLQDATEKNNTAQGSRGNYS